MKALASLGMLAFTSAAAAQAPQPVTVDNFVRAESDLYLADLLKDSGRLGVLNHRREVASVDHQTVIRLNRDTLYSSALFDLDAGPVTITLPDAGQRASCRCRSSARITTCPAVYYKAGAHTLTGRCVGTRYAASRSGRWSIPTIRRTSTKVHALQDAITVSQAKAGHVRGSGLGSGRARRRCATRCSVLASTSTGFGGAFGKRARSTR